MPYLIGPRWRIKQSSSYTEKSHVMCIIYFSVWELLSHWRVLVQSVWHLWEESKYHSPSDFIKSRSFSLYPSSSTSLFLARAVSMESLSTYSTKACLCETEPFHIAEIVINGTLPHTAHSLHLQWYLKLEGSIHQGGYEWQINKLFFIEEVKQTFLFSKCTCWSRLFFYQLELFFFM